MSGDETSGLLDKAKGYTKRRMKDKAKEGAGWGLYGGSMVSMFPEESKDVVSDADSYVDMADDYPGMYDEAAQAAAELMTEYNQEIYQAIDVAAQYDELAPVAAIGGLALAADGATRPFREAAGSAKNLYDRVRNGDE